MTWLPFRFTSRIWLPFRYEVLIISGAFGKLITAHALDLLFVLEIRESELFAVVAELVRLLVVLLIFINPTVKLAEEEERLLLVDDIGITLPTLALSEDELLLVLETGLLFVTVPEDVLEFFTVDESGFVTLNLAVDDVLLFTMEAIPPCAVKEI